MSVHVIKVPDIGEGIAEVELAEWHVQPGDSVAEDQPLADVMTDKATVEVPSPVAGKVTALGGKAGDVLQVGSELIRIEVAEEVTNTPAAVPPAPTFESGKPLASPSVRQHARDLDVDLHAVRGSGPRGRIRHEDIDGYMAGGDARPVMPALPAGAGGETVIPVIGLRRKIAQKMQEAKQHIPHFTYVEEIDMTECEALRVRLNEKYATQRGRLTLLPLLIRALVLAVREFPQVNTRYDDAADMLTRYGAVHLGVATQTDGGLMVPVLRHAETLDLWACAKEISRIAEAARNGRAAKEELSGSTITLTSLGALGGIVSTPIINHPEVAIVGINRMVERPVIRNGLVTARQMMNLSSSFDHRVVDGMDAAKFIQAMRGYLEVPATLFVE
jgi:2-oxoisovalerate dehydrogenase E2 component (dihydrolipoyl transacylase)